MKRILPLVFTMLLLLTACGENAGTNEPKDTTPPDLTGEWKQTNSNSDDSWQSATITADTIEIYWVSDNGDTTSLYWAGTFVAPETADEPYTWDSENDHEKTDLALLASGDDTKTFTYEDGQISYSASALGTTTTIRLEKTADLSEPKSEEAEETATGNESLYGRSNPAPVGVAQTLSVDDYSGVYSVTIVVNEVLYGDEVESVMGPSVANDRPDDGYEIVIANVTLKLDEYESDGSLQFDKYSFDVFTSNNESVGSKYVNLEKGGYFDSTIYEGGTVEGYIAVQRKVGDTGAKMAFGLNYDGTGGIWFSL